MRQFIFSLTTCIFLASASPVHAQEVPDIRFAPFLERLPKPKATLNETIAAYGTYDLINNELKQAGKEIEGSLDALYTPFYEMFKKQLAAGKASRALLSKEERDMLDGYEIGTTGVTESNRFIVFKLAMNQRPLVGSGKLSWTKLQPGASYGMQNLYTQVKELELQFDWKGFARQAEIYKPKFVETGDEELKPLQQKLDNDFKALPKKKVKMMEGLYDDIEDPVKAVPLLKQHKIALHAAFEKQYALRYKWWSAAYEKLTAMSQRLDVIAREAGNANATSADRSVHHAIIDLQGRTWEAWEQLLAVSQGLFMRAVIAATAQSQLDESIRIYSQYKDNE